jgi:translocation and assembly module TamB
MRALSLSLKLLAAALALALVLLLALAAALWQWSGSDGSLARLLQQAPIFLPAGQSLEVKDVSGSIQAGGRIGMLRWTRGGLSVQADELDIAWSLKPLLQGQLRVSQLTANRLTIDDKRPPPNSQALAPPSDLRLPLTVDIPFVFHTVHLSGATQVEARDISGHYIFDSHSHRLDEGQGTISYGSYQIKAALQAQAPMALTLQLDGVVQTKLPTGPQQLTVQAHATLEGELAQPDATLKLHASLQPDLAAPKGGTGGATHAMQAQVSAQIRPWQAQPLAQLSAQWQALNLAAVWPGAPQTELAGSASVMPSGASWRAQVNASNSLPGPWNLGRLPLTAIKTSGQYTQGQWVIDALNAQGAGGSITGQGSFHKGQWQGSANLSGINPAALDSRLSSATLNGKLEATQSHNGIGFNTHLRATPSPSTSAQATQPSKQLLDLGQLSLDAQGIWSAPQLSVTALRLDALDAHVQGSLDYHTVTHATRANITLSLPGLQGTFNGHLSSTDGLGSLALTLNDAGQTAGWLTRWPLPAALRDALPDSGMANLKADWQGGWQSRGQQLKLTATLKAPSLTWTKPQSGSPPDPTPVQIHDTSIDITGSLAALRLSSTGAAARGPQRLQWQADLSGAQVSADHWQGALSTFKIGLQPDPNSGSWTILADTARGQAISMDWLQDSAGQKFTLGQGSARLTSPLPKNPEAASLSWQTANWSTASTGKPDAKPLVQWQSQGKLSGLPLSWIDVLGFKSLRELGLQSDVLLGGAWEASQTDSLKLRAVIERSSGDLVIAAGEDPTQTQSAGVSQARLQLQVLANDVSASLLWDSGRAGQATFKLETRLLNQNGSRVWPSNAPVSGSFKVQMPPIEAWSALAPPGWRLRGLLDANATLSGTRAEPHWRGSLQARDLAVRSVADGIDFQQGSLMARLEGQQLLIDAFTLHGAGKDSGQVSVSGSAEWRATDAPKATPLDHVDMHLEASARALRLSTRSDRRMTVSGNLTADLKDARLQLRGDLTADRATITLPSENAPALGDDVVVRPTRTVARSASSGPTPNVKHPGVRIVPEVQISFDLGPDFQVRGRGLETRLAGKLELLASGGYPPTLTGTVNTVRGSYQAYGQRLNIEQGIVRFVGPVDNPVLDILAIRPNLTQRVGVQVIGTVLFPVVRLYAEPDLPEAEKLAWLVMGRSASGSGGEAALLQQAAMALLGGSGQGPTRSLTQALGLDDLGFRSGAGNADNTASGVGITLGKRLSNEFYVAYESGLAGTMGVVSIFYDLSRSLTLRAKTGDQSAMDVIWTRRYD